MNFLIVLPDLRLGGAEKNMVNLANALHKRGHSVFIVLVIGSELSIFSDIEEGVEIIRFKFQKFRSLIFRPFKLINFIRKRRIDVVMGGYGELNPLVAIFSVFFKNVTFIARETSIPSLHIKKSLHRIFYNLTYNLFERIIVQSESMKADLILNFRIDQHKIVLIPNVLDTDKIDILCNEVIEIEKLPTRKFILFVGTINLNKRLDKVVDFHRRLLKEGHDFDLVVIGNGPLFELLRDDVIRKGNQGRIHIVGSVLNPYVYMWKASFIIIASDYEGFPNVGIEAQYCGVPIILSHHTRGGAKELILSGINGEIIDLEKDNLGFINKSYDASLISDTVKEKHSVKNVVNRYLDLF